MKIIHNPKFTSRAVENTALEIEVLVEEVEEIVPVEEEQKEFKIIYSEEEGKYIFTEE